MLSAKRLFYSCFKLRAVLDYAAWVTNSIDKHRGGHNAANERNKACTTHEGSSRANQREGNSTDQVDTPGGDADHLRRAAEALFEVLHCG